MQSTHCATCHQPISEKSYMTHNGLYFHMGEGKWDAESCYNKHLTEEKEFSSLEEGMGCK